MIDVENENRETRLVEPQDFQFSKNIESHSAIVSPLDTLESMFAWPGLEEGSISMPASSPLEPLEEFPLDQFPPLTPVNDIRQNQDNFAIAPPAPKDRSRETLPSGDRVQQVISMIMHFSEEEKSALMYELVQFPELTNKVLTAIAAKLNAINHHKPMNLKEQLQGIIDSSSKFNISPILIEKAVSPVFVKFAKPLQNVYYAWQNKSDNEQEQGELIITVLENRANPKLTKKVIYAFPSIAIAGKFLAVDPRTTDIVEIPVAHLLFHLLGTPPEELESVIFVKKIGNNLQFQEVKCDEIKKSVQEKIKKLKPLLETFDPNTRLV